MRYSLMSRPWGNIEFTLQQQLSQEFLTKGFFQRPICQSDTHHGALSQAEPTDGGRRLSGTAAWVKRPVGPGRKPETPYFP